MGMTAGRSVLKSKGCSGFCQRFYFQQVQLNCQRKIIQAKFSPFLLCNEPISAVLDSSARVQGIVGGARWIHGLPATPDRHSKTRIPGVAGRTGKPLDIFQDHLRLPLLPAGPQSFSALRRVGMALVLAFRWTARREAFSWNSFGHRHELRHSERGHPSSAAHSLSQYGRLDVERRWRFVRGLAAWVGIATMEPFGEISSIIRSFFRGLVLHLLSLFELLADDDGSICIPLD